MSDEFLSVEEMPRLIREGWLGVDVRSPIEVAENQIPGAINLPLMTDDERAQIGTCYKREGREAAIALGHQLVGGAIRQQRLELWLRHLGSAPNTFLFCFRGGLRSQTVQRWCADAGVHRPRLKEGSKGIRRLCLGTIENFSRYGNLWVVSGATGSGKTRLLREQPYSLPLLDLEKWANHRGSAFGRERSEQCAQASFENKLAFALLREVERPTEDWGSHLFLVEDESRLIGRLVQPESFFQRLRASPIVLIEEPVEARVQLIYEEYVLQPVQEVSLEQLSQRLEESLMKIHRRLGGLRTQEIMKGMKDMARAHPGSETFRESALEWIRKLINWYYDPMYFGSLERRNPAVLFRGTRSEAKAFLQQQTQWEPGKYRENLRQYSSGQ